MLGKVYPTYKIAALDTELSQHGVAIDALLDGTDISPDSIHSPDTRISRQQLVQTYRNAVLLSPVSDLGLRTGKRLRLSAYGMYGYALVSSANLRDALTFSIRYHELATPTVSMSLTVDDDDNQAAFVMLDSIGEDAVYRFNLELQFSLVQSLFSDMVGEDFRFSEIRADFPAPPHADVYETYFECPVRFECGQNELCFNEWWLTKPLVRANPITAEMLRETCERILFDMQTAGGFARQVRDILTDDLRRSGDIESVAQRLDMSSRTLRRRLKEEDTSFQALLTEVRSGFAIAYLRDTRMTVDDIADRLGFSDAANFRHAFKRWTGHAPSHYRGRSSK